MSLLIACLALTVLGGLTGCWLFARTPRLRTVAVAEARATLDVLIPARDEAGALPVLLRSLTQQSYLAQRVFVIDDESGDATGAVAAAAGATVLRSSAVPPGWTGKSWACWQGATAASAELLVFLDADTVPRPELLRRLVSEHARLGGLLAVAPFQRMERLSEQLTVLGDVVAGSGVGALARPSGACMVCSRKDYLAVGGHQAIATAAADGPALAARFRARGLPVSTRIGRDAVERIAPTGRRGSVVRRLAVPTHLPARTLAIAVWVLGLGAAAAAPVVGISGSDPILGFAGYAVGGAQIAAVLPRFGNGRGWLALVFPVPVLVFIGLAGWSLVVRARGRVDWKGRSLALRGAST